MILHMHLKPLILSIVSLTLLHSALQAKIINGVDWSNVYEPDATSNNVLPDEASPPWTSRTVGISTVGITANYLTISDDEVAANQSYSSTANWDMSAGMSVEVRIQMVTSLGSLSPIGQIRIGNTAKYIYINFDQTKISYIHPVTGNQITIASGLDLAHFTTVRLTLATDLTLNVYVNNNPTSVGTIFSEAFSDGAANNIIFGDITGTGTAAAGGTSNWNYIAYTAGVHPVARVR